MSVQTEIDRLAAAKAAIKSAIEGKGVTVPDATTLDGFAALIGAIEAGGGGMNATAGTITVSADTSDFVLTHGLGEVPKFFVIGMGMDFSKLSGKTYLLICAYGFSDVAIQYRISANSTANAPAGVFRDFTITTPYNGKQSLRNATEETITVANSGGVHQLIAGATYYWVAIGSGVFA